MRDLNALVRLFVALAEHHRALQPQNPRYRVSDRGWELVARRALIRDDEAVFVAEEDDRVVGFVRVSVTEKPWGMSCEVGTLMVEESARGKGWGRSLMQAAEEFARAAGTKGIRVDVLEANDAARRFYEAAGYAAFAVRYGKPTPGT
jgi:ribosomal protein S18 acetylase RimI-like enzyme